MITSLPLLIAGIIVFGVLTHFGIFLAKKMASKRNFIPGVCILLLFAPFVHGQFWCIGRALSTLQDGPFWARVGVAILSAVATPWPIVILIRDALRTLASPYTLRQFAKPATKALFGFELSEEEAEILYTAANGMRDEKAANSPW